ncbi:MAG: hypothetical protein ACTSYA_00715 [Candidatus Kariarchaeaceae archaeon]
MKVKNLTVWMILISFITMSFAQQTSAYIPPEFVRLGTDYNKVMYIPTMVLYDPIGSHSYAEFTKEQTTTGTFSFDGQVGTVTGGLEVSMAFTETTTFRTSTRIDADWMGPGSYGDLIIGKYIKADVEYWAWVRYNFRTDTSYYYGYQVKILKLLSDVGTFAFSRDYYENQLADNVKAEIDDPEPVGTAYPIEFSDSISLSVSVKAEFSGEVYLGCKWEWTIPIVNFTFKAEVKFSVGNTQSWKYLFHFEEDIAQGSFSQTIYYTPLNAIDNLLASSPVVMLT